MVQKWMTALDKGELVDSVFLDLKNVFDLVDHDIPIYKFKLYKFNGITLKWFTSYLENRTKVVKVGDNISAKQSIKTGVPQGSILGPLLFLLYINDLPLAVADSAIDLYKTGKQIQAVQINLQHNVGQVEKCCKKNNMSLNSDQVNGHLY